MKIRYISTGCFVHKRSAAISTIRVKPAAGNPRRGWLTMGDLTVPVALGRGGIKANKREGDGATPRGSFRVIRLWWRADRYRRPFTLLPTRPIGPLDAWCENPDDRRYNRPVQRQNMGDDMLRRSDHLYDFIIEIDHNTAPRIRRRGSAVFLHLATESLTPTAGCVAMTGSAMRRLLQRLRPQCRIVIG